MNLSTQNARSGQRPPFAVVLGTNEIASAVAVKLFRSGFFVVLSHDPYPPVIRRKMAFHDALFDDPVAIGGVKAKRADTGLDILAGLRPACHEIMITELGLLDLIVLRTLDALIDARMQKYQTTPDLRPLARLTVGLGPGFCAGTNCDCAVETRPAKTGLIIKQGATDPADGIARNLGGIGPERFVYSPVPGRWHTAIEIGTRVFKDFIIGHLGSETVRAPFDGILRGVARDGTEVPAGVKLLEIDPRGRRASWSGIDKRSRMIASAVMKAIAMHQAKLATPFQRTLTVVK
ncbi:MAG TPA: xanthine dehydrogenase [Methylocella sp.]|nr:xanthine dehydrogenase [Methylocella sp.]